MVVAEAVVEVLVTVMTDPDDKLLLDGLPPVLKGTDEVELG